MGALANYPIALAARMGLNTYFTYSVVRGMGIVSYAALRILAGRFHSKDWLLYTMAVLFLVRFLYMSKN